MTTKRPKILEKKSMIDKKYSNSQKLVQSDGSENEIFSDSCVFKHCQSTHGLDNGINFFKFPTKTEEQCNLWLCICNLASINQYKDSYGKLKIDMDKMLICSLHFEKGYPSKDSNDINYVPTLYTSANEPRPIVDEISGKIPMRQPTLRGQKICLVFGCESGTVSNPQLEYFKLPKGNRQQAKIWIEILRISPENLDGVVCSKHFMSGRPSCDEYSVDFKPTFSLDGSDLPSNIQKENLCIIDDCESEIEETEFYHFPKHNKEQCKIWEKRVSRKNGFSSDWKHNPKNDLICWEHFRRNRPNPKETYATYAPVFPASQCNVFASLCIVPGCGSPLRSPFLRFFKLPIKNPAQRLEWIKAIRRNVLKGYDWTVPAKARICEKHFVKGEPSKDRENIDFIPTLLDFRPPDKFLQILKKKANVNFAAD